MSKNEADNSDETYLDNAVPVQAFSTSVIAPGQETDARSRQCRPSRDIMTKPRSAADSDGSTRDAGRTNG